MISMHNLHFSHAKRAIISGLSTDFAAGKVHAILGANGAGKSTLLKLLAGELKPQQGGIYIDDIPLSHFSLIALAQIRAVLPQNPALNFSLMVRDIVGMGAYPFQQLTHAQINQLIDQCLHLTDTQHLAHRPYLALSGGEQQRSQLARTLVQVLAPVDNANKRFLLLDEPTASLDPRHQHHVLQLAKKLATERNMGVIIVLHDVNLAAQYADDILLLADSELIAHGPSWDVLTEKNLERVYHLRPAIVPHPLTKQPLVLFG